MKIAGHEVEILSKTTAKVGCVTVTMEETQGLMEAMECWKPANTFRVGDFVKVKEGVTDPLSCCPSLPSLVGKFGKVVHIKHTRVDGIAVEFPHFLFGHDCNGHSAKGHGYYLTPEMLEKVE